MATETLRFEQPRERIARGMLGGKRQREFVKDFENLSARRPLSSRRMPNRKADHEGLKQQAEAVEVPS